MSINSTTTRQVPQGATGSIDPSPSGFPGSAHAFNGTSPRSFVDSASANGSLPDDDTSRTIYAHLKASYGDLLTYVGGGRDERLAEINTMTQRIQLVMVSLEMVPPDAKAALQTLINEQQLIINQKLEEIQSWDANISVTRGNIVDSFNWLMAHMKDDFAQLIKDFQWPTIEVCQDLSVSPEIAQLTVQALFTGSAGLAGEGGNPSGSGSDNRDETIMRLEQMIRSLQEKQTALVRSLENKKGLNAGANRQDAERDNVYRERRRRCKVPTFKEGSANDAQEWISRYESLSGYLGFSDLEKVEELHAVFEGRALNWFNSLVADEKTGWSMVKTKFLHQFGGGANPSLTALDQLKKLKQGNSSIGEFAPALLDLLHRAQIFTPAVQLDQFKDKIRPELRNAVIFARATTIESAIEIATEIERELIRSGGNSNASGINTTYLFPSTGRTYGESSSGSGTSSATGEQQNVQFGNRKPKEKLCFHCKKPGHFKRDCFKLRNNKKNTKYVQNIQEQQEVEMDTDEDNIFRHFLNTQQDGSLYGRSSRIRVSLMDDGGSMVHGLADSGSTITTIRQDVVSRLSVSPFPCKAISIHYGNNSVQHATTQVTVGFKMADGVATQVTAYVVNVQNEDIILGADWMEQEDMVLYMKEKVIRKNDGVQGVQNSMELVQDIIQKDFPTLIDEGESQNITNAPYKHRIDTGDATPVAVRDYRRSDMENRVIKEEVQKMLDKKVIVPSNSEWCAPVVLIKKPDDSFRFCIDYRELNKRTVKDKYPLPRITELIDKLHGSKYFTTIDLKSGYWQLPLDPRDAKKTAFVANGELYEFTCLPFGVVNGPPSFMRLMHYILRGLPNTLCYLDDIICHDITYEEHLVTIRRVLERLEKYNLRISLKKCQFFMKEVKFLGFLVSGQGIRSDPSKVEVVKTWPVPTSVKALKRFLGFCAFYHRFIANLSDVAKPLYKLLTKENTYNWNFAANKAFEDLRTKMTVLPTLAYPNPNLPYDLHCDASLVGVGAAIVQAGRPIAFASRTLSSAEQNYSTTERECLAIVWALNYFHPYLYGAQFTIYSDHAALKSILSTKMPRGRIARWILTLQSYQFTIVHRKGALCGDADALSRLPEEQVVNSQDLEEVSKDGFKKLQDEDKFIQNLRKGEVKHPYVWKNEILCRQYEDLVAPVLPRSMVPMILKRYHDDALGSHFGVDKTIGRIKTIAFWPTMVNDVKEYIRTCAHCQKYKIRNESTVPNLKPILPRYTGDIWAMDVAELPTSKQGNTYILVLMEYLSKWAITIPLSSVTSSQVAQVLLYEVVFKYGVPTRLISDNGANLVSEAVNMVCKRLGIKRSLTSVEHPQTDGLVERLNRTLKTNLAALVTKERKDVWDEYLPFVTFAYNTAPQASTGFSPFELLFGHKAVLPLMEALEIEPKTYETEVWINYLNAHLPLLQGKAIENIKAAQERQRKFYDKNSTVKYDYQVGDLILRKNLNKTGFPKERWTGPWKVIAKNNAEGTSWKIVDPKDNHQHVTTANVRHMRPYYERTLFPEGGDDVMGRNPGSSSA